MWHITKNVLRKSVPGFSGLSEAGQTNAIDTLYQKFVHMSPSELRSIGITSGDYSVINDRMHINGGGVFTAENLRKAVQHAQNTIEHSPVKMAHIMDNIPIFRTTGVCIQVKKSPNH